MFIFRSDKSNLDIVINLTIEVVFFLALAIKRLLVDYFYRLSNCFPGLIFLRRH